MPEEQEKEQTQHDRLTKLFWEQFGSNWRRDIITKVRADALSWFVFLIEAGIEATLRKYREQRSGLDASAIASIACWRTDLENWVNQIEGAVNQSSKGKKSK